VTITPLHHGSLAIAFAGQAVYVDPTKDVSYEGLPKAAAVFVTDIHGDHMDPPAIEKISDAETVVVAPAAVAEKLPKSITNVRVLKNGETTTTKALLVPKIPGLGVETVPMYNKIRGPSPGHFYHDKGRGNGYVLSFGDKRFYISGDTECTDEMKALKDIDVAFVCMNLPYTMPPAEAAECIDAFRPKIVYPYHYRGSDLGELQKALAGKPIEVRLRNWY
jgi:L-ascorbate metabolism protein UlaG (beta-lactamase superfamily)